MSDLIGKTISHYLVLEQVGQGGMGIVYKAEDTKLDRLVALKFLPPHLHASEQDKARFAQEAKAASAINHPNICTIYSIDEHDGPAYAGAPAGKQLFIVMEFVDGQTLREKTKSQSASGGPNPKSGVEIGVQIADGLAAAHEKGIVHRDIKPENIMVRKDGIVQIMDFGLAKLRASGSKITRLTKEGSTVGTAGYMSPEQIQGQDADHRSDIFSLGVLLYELFTGSLPFKGVHETALMYEIVNVDAQPMASVHPGIDPELDRIVYECLQKDREERYQSAKEISRDLKRYRRDSSKAHMSRTFSAQTIQRSASSIPATELPAKQSVGEGFSRLRLWQVTTFVAIVAIIGLLLGIRKTPDVSSRPVTRFTMKLAGNAVIPIGATGVNISPDGRFMSFIIQNGSVYMLVLRSSDHETFETVLGAEVPADVQELYNSFSPDGQWIAFSSISSIRKSSLFGGAPVSICDINGQPRGLWWGSDKNIYIGQVNSSIVRVSESGGTVTQVTTLDSASSEISHRFPQLLPDGKSVLYTIKFNTIRTFDEAAIAVLDTKSGERKVLVRGGTYARYVPTGHLIYGRGSFIYAVPFDLEKLEVKGPPKQLFYGGWMNPYSGELSLAWSNDGTLLYVPRGIESYAVNQIKWIDMHGQITPLVDSLNSYFVTAISPDNQKIALHVQGANDDVWLYHIGRKSMTRITFGGGNNGFPVWSADGKYLTYMSERGKGQNIYRKEWNGSGKEERLTTSDRSQYPRSVSPDGKWLAFLQDGDIWLLALDGSGKTSLFFESPATEGNPMFSPDGKYMAYETNESGKQEVVIVSFPSRAGKWQISGGGATNPIWSPLGGEIYFAQGKSIFAVTIHPGSSFDYSAPRKILDLPPDGAFITGISSDGKRFTMVTLPSKELTTSEVTVVTEWFEEVKNAFAGK